MKTYIDYKNEFIRKHNNADWTVHTTPMNEYGQYSKNYVFTDGATLIEINRPVWETVKVETEVKGIKVVIEQEIKLMETEVWNTDDATSVKFYEKW